MALSYPEGHIVYGNGAQHYWVLSNQVYHHYHDVYNAVMSVLPTDNPVVAQTFIRNLKEYQYDVYIQTAMDTLDLPYDTVVAFLSGTPQTEDPIPEVPETPPLTVSHTPPTDPLTAGNTVVLPAFTFSGTIPADTLVEVKFVSTGGMMYGFTSQAGNLYTASYTITATSLDDLNVEVMDLHFVPNTDVTTATIDVQIGDQHSLFTYQVA